MITFTTSGNFNNMENFLKRMSKSDQMALMNKFGQAGVEALSINTPVETGETAQSWSYTITRTRYSYRIDWSNSNVNGSVPIAILIQYGHGTGTGGYVQGIDYINPAIRPIFESLVDEIWGEVTK